MISRPPAHGISDSPLFTVWIGVTMHLLDFSPPMRLIGGSEDPLTLLSCRHGQAFLVLVGVALALGHAEDVRLHRGESCRRLFGVFAGIGILAIVLRAIDPDVLARRVHADWHNAVPFAMASVALFYGGLLRWTQSCAALFMLLLFLTTAVAAVASFSFGIAAVVAFISLAVLVVRLRPFRYRIPGLAEADYAHPRRPWGEAPANEGAASGRENERSASTAPDENADLLDPVAVLDAWKAATEHRRDAGALPKLVLLAVSGGAYRATFWTAAIIDALAHYDTSWSGRKLKGGEPDLNGLISSIRFVSGASGGMVAGAYLAEVSHRHAVRAQPGAAPSLVATIESDIEAAQRQAGRTVVVPRDSLSSVAWRLVGDLFHIVMPGRIDCDRGRVLEAQWRSLARPFATLAEQECEGGRPSLVFSPMLVESGAPLFISNLDLGKVREHYKDERIDTHSAELFKAFPKAYRATADDGGPGFTVATATRLSATFPFVSPAVSLPTAPRRRVVDAGYYDNFGLDVAAAYLNSDKVRDWIVKNCSGVVILSTRAFPEQKERTHDAGGDDASPSPSGSIAAKAPQDPIRARLARLLWWLTSPIEGMLSARGSTQTYRNRELLRLTRELYGLALAERQAGAPEKTDWRKRGRDFIEIVTFTCTEEASMSWHLSDADMKRIFDAANRCSASDASDMQRLGRFWNNAPGQPPTAVLTSATYS